MNPIVNNNTNNKYYQQSLSYIDSIRDKTKSNLTPQTNYPNNQFSNNIPMTYNHQYQQPYIENISNNYSHLYNNNNTNIHKNNNSFINTNNNQQTNNYSDRYKSYYTEQSYTHDKSKDKYNTKYHQLNNNHNRSTILPHSPTFKQQKSLQRKRFLTTITSRSPDHASLSMINPAKQNTKQTKQPYQFAAHKLAISKVDNNTKVQNNYQQKSRQKRLFNVNNDPNKKISLKRDIISPRYQQFEKHKKNSLIEQRSKPDLGMFQKTFSSNYLSQKDSFIADSNFKKREDFYFQGESGLMKMEKLVVEQIGNEVKKVQDLVDVSNKNVVKKNQSKVRKSTIVLQQDQKKQTKQQQPNIIQQTKKQYHYQREKNPKNIQLQQVSQQKQQSFKLSNPLMIDNDIYQDMKISRIEQSTFGLQEKYHQLQKVLQKLKKSDQQHQNQINLLKSKLLQKDGANLSLSQLPENTTNRTMRLQTNNINNSLPNTNQHNDYNHDLKRIKKQLKIIKNNFQLAFTSMTQQINRKLVKQEQIMKNLSEEIKMVATENIKLSQSIEQKSSKVLQLEKSMTSFMQQNQQRIQNLVLLNDSFSSSANKRNRNNHSSFQYGLELKNMSADEGWMSSRDKQAVQGLKIKVEYLQKEIKKMKVYHMQEKEVSLGRVNDIKSNVNQLRIQMDKIKNNVQSNFIKSIVSQLITQRLPLLIQPQTSQIKESVKFLQQLLSEKIKQLNQSMQQMKKSINQQLYEFRLGKLYPLESSNSSNMERLNLAGNTFPSVVSDRQINLLKDKLYTIEQKLSFNEKRLVTIQQKNYTLTKGHQQQKLKQLKHSGDIRQLQHTIKQINSKLIQYTTNNKDLNEGVQNISISLRQFVTNIDSQIVQINRVNQIQTENIQSINNEFQRVINKQIIPKFQQIHNNNVQVQRKLALIKVSLREKDDKIGQKDNFNSYDNNSLKDKIQLYLNENINKFINTKVKLFTTKLISNKSPLTKLGLYQNNYQNTPYQNNSLSSSTVLDGNDYEIDKQNTYLVDQNGYLMDWQGCYLMEVGIDGSKSKIRLTQKEIYFMQVNGINVNQLAQFN